MDKITVRIFNDVKYLSISSATNITPVDNVGEVTNLDGDEELIPDSGNRVLNGSIIGVVSIDSYFSCVNCRGKVDWISGIMGQCTRCNIKLKYGSCNKSQTATLIFQPVSGDNIKISVFNNELETLTSSAAVGCDIEEQLFSIPLIKVCLTSKNVVYSVNFI